LAHCFVRIGIKYEPIASVWICVCVWMICQSRTGGHDLTEECRDSQLYSPTYSPCWNPHVSPFWAGCISWLWAESVCAASVSISVLPALVLDIPTEVTSVAHSWGRKLLASRPQHPRFSKVCSTMVEGRTLSFPTFLRDPLIGTGCAVWVL